MTTDTENNIKNTPESFVEDISPEDLIKLLKYDKNVIVIDIRKPNNQARECKLLGRIRHIDESTIEKTPDIIPDGKTIVLLSEDGMVSFDLARKIAATKSITIYNLRGGMKDYWKWRENIIREKLEIYNDEIDVLDSYGQDFGC